MSFNFAFGSTFSEKEAFILLFGNYDSAKKIANWKNMKFSEKKEQDCFFWKNKTGIVRNILLLPCRENGKRKFFFLTQTIPKDIPFNCHACLPLISATVFSLDMNNWKIDSQSLFLMYGGKYGKSPSAKLISVGKEKKGVLLEFERHGEGHIKESYLVIPYKKKILNAHKEIIYYDNFNDCGRSIHCASFSAKMYFNKKTLGDFYELKIKKIGTENDEKYDYKIVSVNEKHSYYFLNGKYRKISGNHSKKIKFMAGGV